MIRALGLAPVLLVLALPGSSAAAGSSVVGLWHLDEASGTVATDSSGNGNNGTVSGGAQWVPGRFGAALSFDGSSARVRVPDDPSLEPAAAVSVSAWLKQGGSPGHDWYILAKGATGCIAASYGLYSGPGGGLAFYVADTRGKAYYRSPDAGAGVWNDKWHLVVGTFDGTSVRLFVDGTEVGFGTPHSGPIGYSLADSNDLFIGDYPGCILHNFLGAIDDAAVWSRALTTAEVSALLPQPASPSQAGGGPGGGSAPVSVGPAPAPAAPGGRRPAQPVPGEPAAQPGPRGDPPALGHLRVSPSAFAAASAVAAGAGSAFVSRNRSTGATVSYTDTQAATSRFALLVARAGAWPSCIKPVTQQAASRTRRCLRYRSLGSFVHADRAGTNRFRFTGLHGHKLAPGRYRLEATPTAQDQAGTTVSTMFTVVR